MLLPKVNSSWLVVCLFVCMFVCHLVVFTHLFKTRCRNFFFWQNQCGTQLYNFYVVTHFSWFFHIHKMIGLFCKICTHTPYNIYMHIILLYKICQLKISLLEVGCFVIEWTYMYSPYRRPNQSHCFIKCLTPASKNSFSYFVKLINYYYDGDFILHSHSPLSFQSSNHTKRNIYSLCFYVVQMLLLVVQMLLLRVQMLLLVHDYVNYWIFMRDLWVHLLFGNICSIWYTEFHVFMYSV